MPCLRNSPLDWKDLCKVFGMYMKKYSLTIMPHIAVVACMHSQNPFTENEKEKKTTQGPWVASKLTSLCALPVLVESGLFL